MSRLMIYGSEANQNHTKLSFIYFSFITFECLQNVSQKLRKPPLSEVRRIVESWRLVRLRSIIGQQIFPPNSWIT